MKLLTLRRVEMSSIPQPNTVLLLIDIQEGLKHPSYWGHSPSNPSFERNAKLLIATYRSLISSAGSTSLPPPHKIIHIQHASTNPGSPLSPSSPGFLFQNWAAPRDGELVIEKRVHSAFIGTKLEEVLRNHFGGNPGRLWITGLALDQSVTSTVRMAENLGVCDGADGRKGVVSLIEDATAAWEKDDGVKADIVHKVHVTSLRDFATIDKAEEVLNLWQEWIGRQKISHVLYQ